MIFRTVAVMTLAVLLVWPAVCMGALAELDKSPAFQAETLDGRHTGVDSAGNRNPVLLVFWATWCPHCLVEIPNINRLQAKYAPRGLELVAINVGVNDSVARVQLAKQKFGISYPIVFDQGGKITRLYQITGIPAMVLVDRQGTIRFSAPGGVAAKVLSRLEEIVK